MLIQEATSVISEVLFRIFVYIFIEKGIDLSDIPNIFLKCHPKNLSYESRISGKNVDKTRLIKPKIISREEEIDKILEK